MAIVGGVFGFIGFIIWAVACCLNNRYKRDKMGSKVGDTPVKYHSKLAYYKHTIKLV